MFSTLSFWYGLGFDDLSRMPLAAQRAYLRDLPRHQARFQLMLMQAAGAPYMKSSDLRALGARLEQLAEGPAHTDGKALRGFAGLAALPARRVATRRVWTDEDDGDIP